MYRDNGDESLLVRNAADRLFEISSTLVSPSALRKIQPTLMFAARARGLQVFSASARMLAPPLTREQCLAVSYAAGHTALAFAP